MPGAEQQTNIQIGVNASQFVDGLKSATDAAKQFESAIDGLSNTTQKTAQQITMTAASYQKLVQALDPAARSAAQFAAAEQKVQQAVTAGLATREQANKLIDLANQKYNTLSYQAQQAAKAEADAAVKSAQQQAAAYKALEAALDPAVAKKQTLASVEKTLNAAVASGQTTQTRANELTKLATQQYGQLGGAAKITGQQLIIAGDQLRQMSDQMISGGGFIRPILMQVPVAVQVMGGFSNTLDYLKSKIGALVSFGGIAALGAALVAMGYAAESNQRSLNNLSNGLSKFGGDFAGTAQMIRAAAKDLAATTSLGTQEATEALKTLAENPSFTRTQKNFEDTVRAAQKFSVAFGETLQQSAERINQMFADPVAAALEYANKKIAGFTDDFTRHIQDLVNQGHKVQATNEVFTKLSDALKQVNVVGTPLQAALKALNEALTAVGQGAGGASSGIGTGLTNALAGAVNVATAIVKALDSIATSLSNLGVGSTTQGAILVGAFSLMLPPIQKLIGLVATLVKALAGIGPAAAAAAEATVAATAAEGAATAGVAAAGAGGAAVAGAEGAAIAGAGGAAAVAGLPIAAIVAAVLAAGGALIWSYFKNSGAQADLKTQAEQAGFQQYKASNYELPRYANPRTGEDLSTEQLNQKLLGQTMADSFATKLDQWFASHAPSWLGGGTNAPPTGATGGGTQAPIAPLTSLPPAGQQYAPLFTAAETKYGLPTGMLAAVAMRESTFNPLATNPSGAAGMMQIMPGTAQQPGYGITPISLEDRKNPAISIDFAGQLLAAYSQAHGGSLAEGVRQYSGGGYTLSPTAPQTIAPTTKAPAAATTTTTGPGTEQTPLQRAETQSVGAQGTAAATIEQLKVQIQAQEDLKKALVDASNQQGVSEEQQKKYNAEIDIANQNEIKLRQQIQALQSPYQKTIEQQQQQLKVDQELNPAQKAVIQAQQQLIEQNKQLGLNPPTQSELEAVRSGVLTQLAAQYRGVIAAAAAEAASTEKIAAAWDKGALAADHATNYARAWNQIVGAGKTATDAQAAAVELYTAQLDRNSAALEKVAAKQSAYNSGQQLKVLNAQESALGTSAKNQAVVAAQAQKASEYKDPTTPDAQQAVKAAGQVAAKTVDVDREKAAWASVDQAASSAIDDIGSGLESVLSTGKWTGFADAAKKALGDISKELLNLALLNPLKNLLTGGRSNAPTLFDLFNGTNNSNNPLSSGLVDSGGSVSGGSGGGGSGIFGLLGSGLGLAKGPGLFDKTGFFGSEGPLFGSGTGSGVVDSAAWDLGTSATDTLSTATTGLAADAWDLGAFAANGAVFAANGNTFAPISALSGSIVNKPTPFSFGRQTGLMGEAGSEAVLPMMGGGIQTTSGHVLPLGRTSRGQLAVDHLQAFSGLSAWAASQGRGNDSMIAHINPREAMMLMAAGGAGTRHPTTGLMQFDDGGGGGGSAVPPPDPTPAAAAPAPTVFGSSAEAIAAGFTPGNPLNGLSPSTWYKDASGGWGANASLANQYGAMTGSTPYEEANIQFDRGPAIMGSYGPLATQMADFPDNAVPLTSGSQASLQSMWFAGAMQDPRKQLSLDPAVRWLTGGSADFIATAGNPNFSIDKDTGLASLTGAGASNYQAADNWQTRADIIDDMKSRQNYAMPIFLGGLGIVAGLGIGAAIAGAGAGAIDAGTLAADLPSAGAGAATGAGAGPLGSAAGIDFGAATAGAGAVDTGVWDLPGAAASGASSTTAAQSTSIWSQLWSLANNPYVTAGKTLTDIPQLLQEMQKMQTQQGTQQRAANGGVFANDNLDVPQLHTGGFAGQLGGVLRSVPRSAFAGAPRYHSGGMANTTDTLPPQFASDEIPAVLRRNELVMTQGQQRAVASRLGQPNARQPIINQTFHIQTPDADSFRASRNQVQMQMARAMVAASRRM